MKQHKGVGQRQISTTWQPASLVVFCALFDNYKFKQISQLYFHILIYRRTLWQIVVVVEARRGSVWAGTL